MTKIEPGLYTINQDGVIQDGPFAGYIVRWPPSPSRGDRVTDEYITVGELGSGWAAVHMAYVEPDDYTGYWDVQQTGIGRYRTHAAALVEARQWAASDEIRYEGDT